MFFLSPGHSGPEYSPEDVDLSSNYNVLKIAEIHAFEEVGRHRQRYLDEVSEQLEEYSSFYDVDEIWFLGDLGSSDDVFRILDGLDTEASVKLVAGDEDKKRNFVVSAGRDYTGWFAQANGSQPFDVDLEYEIFDEGFETEIHDTIIQAAHHPSKDKRDDYLSHPDNRSSAFLNKLFSIGKTDNENTLATLPPPSMENADMFFYDHVHMPYPREIGGKAVVGLGARRNNHNLDSDCIPERSVHLSSFNENNLIHELHFDADSDDVFEHVAFDPEDDYEIYQFPVPQNGNPSSFYKPIQGRFHKEHFDEEAKEYEEDQPEVLFLD